MERIGVEGQRRRLREGGLKGSGGWGVVGCETCGIARNLAVGV